MTAPRITFACELSSGRLAEVLGNPPVIESLKAQGRRVALALADFSPERAGAVRQLNEEGVPVVAIPLLPFNEGYYFTADNYTRAAERYQEWKSWSSQEHLAWDGVGLDIEPDIQTFLAIAGNPWRLPAELAPRLLRHDRPRRAAAAYAVLIERIRADGWTVENYQFPFIADERRAGADFFQRAAGLVDVTTDREVWMLYTSFMRSLGPAMIRSYGPQAQAIAVGSTGGGPDIPGQPQVPSLSWDELQADLRLAHRFCHDLYVHSLEGCVEHGFLERLASIDWDAPVPPPAASRAAAPLRCLLTAALWAGAHPGLVLASGLLTARLRSRARRAGAGSDG